MRSVRALTVCLSAAVVLTGCTTTPGGTRDQAGTRSPSASSTPTQTPTVPPDPGPRPEVGECHDLSFGQAAAVVDRSHPVPCRRRHTAETYFVGRLELETASGHTRRADSRAAQRQARTSCTSRLARHLGLAPRELRLRMAQAVWFTPSPQRAEAGADWFRCDVVAVAAPRKLLQLPRRTK